MKMKVKMKAIFSSKTELSLFKLAIEKLNETRFSIVKINKPFPSQI